jgi:hypothetical protein
MTLAVAMSGFSGPITWEQMVFVGGAIVAALALWLRIEGFIKKAMTTIESKIIATEGKIATLQALHEMKIATVQDNLVAFKLEVANDYARNGYLRDVEERVLKRIGEIVSEIHGVRDEIAEAVKMMMHPPAAGRRGK